MEEYKINLLKLVAEHDMRDALYWSEDLSFYFLCNDIFFWGCADGEDVENQQDVDLLEQCIKDCQTVRQFGEVYASQLYCAKKRKMRPQGAYYKHIEVKELWPLFDACGPEREVNFGNTKPRPTE
jgi:hypothetical protein